MFCFLFIFLDIKEKKKLDTRQSCQSCVLTVVLFEREGKKKKNPSLVISENSKIVFLGCILLVESFEKRNFFLLMRIKDVYDNSFSCPVWWGGKKKKGFKICLAKVLMVIGRQEECSWPWRREETISTSLPLINLFIFYSYITTHHICWSNHHSFWSNN